MMTDILEFKRNLGVALRPYMKALRQVKDKKSHEEFAQHLAETKERIIAAPQNYVGGIGTDDIPRARLLTESIIDEVLGLD